jgi:hypothetical protein
MLEMWKITARPKDLGNEETGPCPGAIRLLAWHERGGERYSLTLKNDGHYREMFASLIGRGGADEVVRILAANKPIDLPGFFTTRQINSLGFRL